MSTAKLSHNRTSVIVAGDIGGTKTRLGLFDSRASRPQLIVEREFATREVAVAPASLGSFADEVRRRSSAKVIACIGVAGPVLGDTAQLTNVDWRIDASALAHALNVEQVTLLNDLQALAYGVLVLEDAELHVLQHGTATAGGNIALIAAGTGLGEALLHNVNGRFVPAASEGGQADWAARSERDILVLRDLVHRLGRAAVEQVVSGPGIVNLHRVTHDGACAAGVTADDSHAPAAIARAAIAGRCRGCMEALGIFVEAFGAEAGNLALRSVSTGGLFVGGGIPPRMLPALSDGRFMHAFLDKAPFKEMLARIPIKVILNPQAGLLGAAVYASTLR